MQERQTSTCFGSGCISPASLNVTRCVGSTCQSGGSHRMHLLVLWRNAWTTIANSSARRCASQKRRCSEYSHTERGPCLERSLKLRHAREALLGTQAALDRQLRLATKIDYQDWLSGLTNITDARELGLAIAA